MLVKGRLLFQAFVSILLIFLTIAVVLLYRSSKNSEYVVVNNQKLFEGFNMAKEMKRIGEKEFQFRKATVDSLYRQLQGSTLSPDQRKVTLQHFAAQKENLEQFSQAFAEEESAKIWARVETYADDFAHENHYNLILSSENRRTVLYASNEKDVTAELLNYINKKYEGKK